MITKKRPEEYLEHRRFPSGLKVALDVLPGNHAAIIASAGHVATLWEYNSVTAAMQAWFAWDPTQNTEPAGFVMRRDVSSKQVVEVL